MSIVSLLFLSECTSKDSLFPAMASTYFLDHVPPSARQEHTKLELPEDVLIRVANYLDVYGLAKLRRTGRKGRRCADLSVLQMRIDESRSDRMDRTMYMNRDERVRHFIAQVRLSAIACVHRATSFFVEGCKNSYEDLIDMQEWADFLGLCLCACGASANKVKRQIAKQSHEVPL